MTERTDREEPFLLLLDGPSCGGKSTVADAIMERVDGIFLVRRDIIKWLFSDYSSGRYGKELEAVLQSMIEIALGSGISVVCDGTLTPTDIQHTAESNGAEPFTANISAPPAVLRERFQERVRDAKGGARIANTDPDRFEKLRKSYEQNKVETSLEFDSSQEGPQIIAQRIISALGIEQPQ